MRGPSGRSHRRATSTGENASICLLRSAPRGRAEGRRASCSASAARTRDAPWSPSPGCRHEVSLSRSRWHPRQARRSPPGEGRIRPSGQRSCGSASAEPHARRRLDPRSRDDSADACRKGADGLSPTWILRQVTVIDGCVEGGREVVVDHAPIRRCGNDPFCRTRESAPSMSIRGGFRRPVSIFASQSVLRPTRSASTTGRRPPTGT